MTFIISGKKMTLAPDIKEKIEKKLSKLDRYFSADSQTHVVLSEEKGLQIMEVTVNHNGTFFRAQQATDDMVKTLDMIVDILERQIRKNKTRLEKRLRDGAFDYQNPVETVKEDEDYDLVRVKTFALKPMSTEEAILQMNLIGHAFFVFRSVDTGRTSVVYKRNDGGYGLIDPQ